MPEVKEILEAKNIVDDYESKIMKRLSEIIDFYNENDHANLQAIYDALNDIYDNTTINEMWLPVWNKCPNAPFSSPYTGYIDEISIRETHVAITISYKFASTSYKSANMRLLVVSHDVFQKPLNDVINMINKTLHDELNIG